jgi:hypothetical protein
MIIRHAEKPETYGNSSYKGINAVGEHDKESLVTLGWERAGGIASLFAPANGSFQSTELETPATIYAANPADKEKDTSSGQTKDDEPSQRPYQTISALAAKLGNAVTVDTSHGKSHYAKMVKHALECSGTVLISWQHQDILPKQPGDDCIVSELLSQSGTSGLAVPPGPWPGDRYDMVLVFDRKSGEGPFETFTQVPQMLLAGDVEALFPM